MGLKIPKVMIAAVKSGSGKTTVTCAFLKQLLCRKKHPVSFKCGPDYIDPMFHREVLGIDSQNLDLFFCEKEQLTGIFAEHAKNADLGSGRGCYGIL